MTRVTDADGEWEETTLPNGVKARHLVNPSPTFKRPNNKQETAQELFDKQVTSIINRAKDLGLIP